MKKRLRIKGLKIPPWAVVLVLLLAACNRFFAAAPHRPGGSAWNQSEEAGHSQEALVERVVDGDTVVLSGGTRVRYIGVDTPELHHPKKPIQAYAREAMEFNRKLVESKKIRLEFDVERHDKYGRLLAYVYLEDGTFVNGELVRQGYAHTLTIPPNVKYADLFVKHQREAREAKRGLWGL